MSEGQRTQRNDNPCCTNNHNWYWDIIVSNYLENMGSLDHAMFAAKLFDDLKYRRNIALTKGWNTGACGAYYTIILSLFLSCDKKPVKKDVILSMRRTNTQHTKTNPYTHIYSHSVALSSSHFLRVVRDASPDWPCSSWSHERTFRTSSASPSRFLRRRPAMLKDRKRVDEIRESPGIASASFSR